MAAYIKTIKNADGDSIYPQTKTSAVYTNEGVNIEKYFKKMQDQLDSANNTIADLTETIANLMYQQSLTQLNSNTTTESGGTT